MKQKQITVDAVPKSYFINLEEIGKRAVGKKLNTLLEALLIKDKGNSSFKLDNKFEIINYSPLINPYRHKPILYSKAEEALDLATRKFSTAEKKVSELEIINQVFYQDFHNIRK
jgi:hypothetical protein